MADRGAYGKGAYGVDFYSYDPFVYFNAAASFQPTASAALGKWAKLNATGQAKVVCTEASFGVMREIAAPNTNVHPNIQASLGRSRPYFAMYKVAPTVKSQLTRVQSLGAGYTVKSSINASLAKWAEMRTQGIAFDINVDCPMVEVLRGWFTDPVAITTKINKPDMKRFVGLWGAGDFDVKSVVSFDVHAVRYMQAVYAVGCHTEAILGRLRPFGAADTFIECFVSRLDMFAGSFWLDDRPEEAGWEPADIATTLWIDDTPKEGGWQSWPTHRLRITS